MRALLQRVNSATVNVDGEVIASIDTGLLVLLGVANGDAADAAVWLAAKTLDLRIFADEHKPMNASVMDVQGAVLVVSQFTLAAETRRGNRPGFSTAAPPHEAEPLYERYVEELRLRCRNVQTGRFGADMQVSLVNEGPVTILLER
ncbi:MAG: D-tyrosyl-tRNA(Tyr) deacylase [Gammaproteobacteria bacterium]|nr:D-tyrosyl-tRNA(Tyr) deacylase [Gammaproteobacteria bacterium]